MNAIHETIEYMVENDKCNMGVWSEDKIQRFKNHIINYVSSISFIAEEKEYFEIADEDEGSSSEEYNNIQE